MTWRAMVGLRLRMSCDRAHVLDASGNRQACSPPPAERSGPGKSDGDAGAVRGNRGAVAAPGDPRGSPRRPRGPSGPHGPGVAFRHPRSASFRSLARIGSVLARVGGAHSAEAAPGSSATWARKKSPDARTGGNSCKRTSRTVGHQRQAFGPGAGRRHVRCWIQTSRLGQRRAIIGTHPRCGDSRVWGYRCRLGRAAM